MVKKRVTIYHLAQDLKVTDGDEIEAGDEVTEGSVNPHDIMNIKRG